MKPLIGLEEQHARALARCVAEDDMRTFSRD